MPPSRRPDTGYASVKFETFVAQRWSPPSHVRWWLQRVEPPSYWLRP